MPEFTLPIRKVSLLLLYLVLSCSFALPQSFQWAKQFTSSTAISTDALACTSSGDILVTGKYVDSVDVDPGPGSLWLFSGHFAWQNTYLTKLDNYGNLIWGKNFAGNGACEVSQLTTDAHDYIYVAGVFLGTIDFDPGPGVFNLTSNVSTSLRDIFLVKLDPYGDFVWAKQFSGPVTEDLEDMETDSDGNILLAGTIYDSLDADPGAGAAWLTCADFASKAMLIKVSSAGLHVWSAAFGDPALQYNKGASVSADGANNVYLAGTFFGSMDADPGPDTVYISAFVNRDGFVLKFDETGSYQWAATFSSPSEASTDQVAATPSGSVYIAGLFRGTLDADPGPGILSFTSSGSFENGLYVAAISDSGTLIWANAFEAGKFNSVSPLTTDAGGNLFLQACFTDTMDADPGPATLTLAPATFADMYAGAFSKTGALLWGTSLGISSLDQSHDLVADGSGNLIFGGQFNAPVDFDPSPAAEILTPDFTDGYVVKWATGITQSEDLTTGPIVSIFPNPVAEHLFIHWKQGEATLTLTDMQGCVLKEFRNLTSPVKIDVQALPAGMYLLHWRQGAHRQALKVLKY